MVNHKTVVPKMLVVITIVTIKCNVLDVLYIIQVHEFPRYVDFTCVNGAGLLCNYTLLLLTTACNQILYSTKLWW